MSNHHVSKGRSLCGNACLALVLASVVLLAGPSVGQQAKTGDAAAKQPAAKKPSGRLPTYFAAVVSQKQREAIYKLQADYEAQLEKLQAQIDALVVERDREVDALLSAEQLAEVNKKREEAKKKRAERSSSKASETKTTEG